MRDAYTPTMGMVRGLARAEVGHEMRDRLAHAALRLRRLIDRRRRLTPDGHAVLTRETRKFERFGR